MTKGAALSALAIMALSHVGETVRAAARSQGATAEVMAAAVWEQAIAAKGGRDRLRAVRNFVVSSREEFRSSPRPDVATYEYLECLYDLDGRLWEFSDHRPGLMGASGRIIDVRSRFAWGSVGRPEPNAVPDLLFRFVEGQYLYLMETAHIQPRPVSVRSERLRNLDVDIVETRVDDLRVDFALDRRTHLPVRVVTLRTLRPERPPFQIIYRLSNYTAIEGVQMAGAVQYGDGASDTKTSYRFNVDFDESTFDPHSVRFDVNGWMKR